MMGSLFSRSNSSPPTKTNKPQPPAKTQGGNKTPAASLTDYKTVKCPWSGKCCLHEIKQVAQAPDEKKAGAASGSTVKAKPSYQTACTLLKLVPRPSYVRYPFLEQYAEKVFGWQEEIINRTPINDIVEHFEKRNIIIPPLFSHKQVEYDKTTGQHVPPVALPPVAEPIKEPTVSTAPSIDDHVAKAIESFFAKYIEQHKPTKEETKEEEPQQPEQNENDQDEEEEEEEEEEPEPEPEPEPAPRPRRRPNVVLPVKPNRRRHHHAKKRKHFTDEGRILSFDVVPPAAPSSLSQSLINKMDRLGFHSRNTMLPWHETTQGPPNQQGSQGQQQQQPQVPIAPQA